MKIDDYVHDDDRTPRERRPQEPVRCLEDELLPRVVVPGYRCTTCGAYLPQVDSDQNKVRCGPCRRDATNKAAKDRERARKPPRAPCRVCGTRAATAGEVCGQRRCMSERGWR